jgi:RNA polymerase sigma-70 factor (ECF subfamily)
MAVVLADKLAELPEHYRRAIVLHHIEGLSIAEVARRLDRSPQATNSLLARALVKLRSLMKGAT